MKKNLQAAVIVGMVLISFAAVAAAKDPRLAVVIQTDKLDFAPGERFPVAIEVNNQTPSPARFTFATSQRYELILEDAAGRKLWRWSRGRFFLQAIGQVVLKPAQVGLRMKATVPAPTRPGRYTLRLMLTSSDHPLESRIGIEIH
jgi:hypothetical protein